MAASPSSFSSFSSSDFSSSGFSAFGGSSVSGECMPASTSSASGDDELLNQRAGKVDRILKSLGRLPTVVDTARMRWTVALSLAAAEVAAAASCSCGGTRTLDAPRPFRFLPATVTFGLVGTVRSTAATAVASGRHLALIAVNQFNLWGRALKRVRSQAGQQPLFAKNVAGKGLGVFVANQF